MYCSTWAWGPHCGVVSDRVVAAVGVEPQQANRRWRVQYRLIVMVSPPQLEQLPAQSYRCGLALAGLRNKAGR
jgi:hypothetical protein